MVISLPQESGYYLERDDMLQGGWGRPKLLD